MPESNKPHWSDPAWIQTEILSSLSMILSVLQSIHQQQLVEYGSRERAVTKCDLERLTMKVSELGTNIDGIKAKITKIADEQQKRYDEIMVKLQAALDALANSDADVPADVTAKLDEVNTLLTAFDDTIPETATPPVA